MSESMPLIDRFGRAVTYLRLSVTDRCDLRCTYCMSERMTFLPKSDLLTLNELERVVRLFIARGVKKIRITGGEPLLRKGIPELLETLGPTLQDDLDELTLTTNATRLKVFTPHLVRAGVKRINVSLDTLDSSRFLEITRRGNLSDVLAGIDTALEAGLAIKLNTVALKHQNTDEIAGLMEWAHAKGMDMTLIEVMPLGETGEDRFDQYIPLTMIRDELAKTYTLTTEIGLTPNSGPSRFVHVRETGGRLGFITPLTHNFCAGCNRVRVTCTGRIYMCLGREDHVDLRAILRAYPDDDAPLHAALDLALSRKPEKHDFAINAPGQLPALTRHMSMTGG